MRNLLLIILLINNLFMPHVSMAENENDQPVSDENFPVPQGFYFYIGDLQAESVANELEHPVADFALGIGIAFKIKEFLELHYELMGLEAEYNTPATVSGGPFTIVGEDMHLTSVGVSVIPVFRQLMGDIELYAGIGLGMF